MGVADGCWTLLDIGVPMGYRGPYGILGSPVWDEPLWMMGGIWGHRSGGNGGNLGSMGIWALGSQTWGWGFGIDGDLGSQKGIWDRWGFGVDGGLGSMGVWGLGSQILGEIWDQWDQWGFGVTEGDLG